MFYPSLMHSCQPSLCPRAWLSSFCACAHSAGEQREINHSSSYSQPSAWHLCSCRDKPRSYGRNTGRIQVNCRGKGKDPGAEAELDTPAGLPGHSSHPALSAGFRLLQTLPGEGPSRVFLGLLSVYRREPLPAGAISLCSLKCTS